eukprot:TRINITY_DN8537_c0_g1_i3.p2 TRINITY_DN8537_c0_g1~~TRINITY_DN8537_c0_g1_i3.p2  ORF type:complete len:177 (+),score=28.49 TRINITY_DN8537_c0_g1_i3:14-544(+)
MIARVPRSTLSSSSSASDVYKIQVPQRAVVIEAQPALDPGLVGARAALKYDKYDGDEQVQCRPVLACIPKCLWPAAAAAAVNSKATQGVASRAATAMEGETHGTFHHRSCARPGPFPVDLSTCRTQDLAHHLVSEPSTCSTPSQHTWVRRAGRGTFLEHVLQHVSSDVVFDAVFSA